MKLSIFTDVNNEMQFLCSVSSVAKVCKVQPQGCSGSQAKQFCKRRKIDSFGAQIQIEFAAKKQNTVIRLSQCCFLFIRTKFVVGDFKDFFIFELKYIQLHDFLRIRC